ncbi:hypothetical protein OUZ56_020562 [Daphnia magna]|uniref:Uncharacterized protein n=1 Tax=Daphnia magna TaxID=35525 RepID=A0ABQ9ZEU1_9CRUS|nr:hypothetical protein OUZ56_020562 [Daphnia magna]
MPARSLVPAVVSVASSIFPLSALASSSLLSAQPNDRHGTRLKSPTVDPGVRIDATSFLVYPRFGDAVVHQSARNFCRPRLYSFPVACVPPPIPGLPLAFLSSNDAPPPMLSCIPVASPLRRHCLLSRPSDTKIVHQRPHGAAHFYTQFRADMDKDMDSSVWTMPTVPICPPNLSLLLTNKGRGGPSPLSPLSPRCSCGISSPPKPGLSTPSPLLAKATGLSPVSPFCTKAAPISYSQASGWVSKGFVLSGYANCAAPFSAFFRASKLSLASAPQYEHMPRNALMFFTFAALEPSTGGCGKSLTACTCFGSDLPLSDVPVPRAVLARVRPTTESTLQYRPDKLDTLSI